MTEEVTTGERGGRRVTVKATPAVRALARRKGVDLALVAGSGADGMITAADVERAATTLSEAGPLEPLRGVRRAMASRMAHAHAEVVPATVSDEADVGGWRGRDVTVRLVRAIVAGCAREPALNVWYNSQSQGRRLHRKIDLGIAVDTEDGLFVPVLRDVANRERGRSAPRPGAHEGGHRGAHHPARGDARRHDHAVQLRLARRPLRRAGRGAAAGRDPEHGPGQGPAGGGRRRDRRAAGHAAVAHLRPPGRDRRRGGALPGGGDRRSRAAATEVRRPALARHGLPHRRRARAIRIPGQGREHLVQVVEHPEMAGVGHEAGAAVGQRRGEPARDRDRHLGIRLAVPEPHRHVDLVERERPTAG